MTSLEWDKPGERLFEAGVDRGVLYPNSGVGVPWNGLVSVNEQPSGGAATPYYLDGYKFVNEASPEEFEATLEAYTYPDEFSNLDGSTTSGSGLIYEQQVRESFGLSYRTRVGNDVNSVDHGYKIHIVYNALAAPTGRANTTLGNSYDANNFSWKISAKPELISARRPTAHLIIDTTKSSILEVIRIENILYGTYNTAPRLPTPNELVELFDDWVRLEISPDSSGGLADLIFRGKPDLKGDTSVGLYSTPDGTRLVESSIQGLYTLE